MTDRYNYLTVALSHDMRDDDAQSLIEAIKMLRGVSGVEPNVTDCSNWTAQIRANDEWRNKLITILKT